jgi:hypothetical protein
MGAGIDSVKNTLDSVGFNVDWQATDRLSLEFDYHDSTSESVPNSRLGSSMTLAITDPDGRASAGGYYGSDLPILEIGHRSGGAVTPDDMLIGGGAFSNAINDQNIEQAKIAGAFELNDIASIDFGVQATDVDNRFASIASLRAPCSATPGVVSAPREIFRTCCHRHRCLDGSMRSAAAATHGAGPSSLPGIRMP